MKTKAQVIKLNQSAEDEYTSSTRIALDSGRQIMVHSNGETEWFEVAEADGRVTLTIQMTEEGPLVKVSGACLELTSPRKIALKAKAIEIQAEEKAVMESQGSLEVASAKEIRIHSEEDIRANGKMIYLN